MAGEKKHEKFEYEGVKNKLIELRNNYTDYVNAVNKIDLVLNSELNGFSNSALFNVQGSNILSLWDNYCSKCKAFLYVFEKWTDAIVTVYNNNISFENANPGSTKVDKISLKINPATYSRENTELLARLLSGDNTVRGTLKYGIETITIEGLTYQISRDAVGDIVRVTNINTEKETINHKSSYEAEINSKYQELLDSNMIDEEWNEYLNNLPKEPREYATILANGYLAVSSSEVENILNKSIDTENNMAKQIAEKNKIPEGWVTYVDEDSFIHQHDSADDYIELENTAYQKVCHVHYTKEGEKAFKKYKKNLSNFYNNFKETGKLVLNGKSNIFYSSVDQCIHYPDGSILQLDDKEYSWTLNLLLYSSFNEAAFEELFMTANGYLTYDLDERCEGYR